MRTLSIAIALIAFPVLADEKAKPNTLTPKEIADGWILLFDGETTFGWQVEGDAKVKDGALRFGGGKEDTVAELSTVFGAMELRLECSADGVTWEDEIDILDSQMRLTRKGGMTLKGIGKKTPVTGYNLKDYRLAMMVIKGGDALYVRSVRCRPTAAQPLFNGKDLSGWKEFKPAKDKKVASKFTVTKESWLNVKDGPGDLQTEGQWADFVAQLDCISNGKHLNSGLFFRCIPGQYQQGYEAQIRNQWEGDDRTRPVDFGTGAIYRRQKARKVVSTDGEWFTMTVAAHGRHIATWVNG
jgi:3-keto-disaccharide hydrolase